MGTRDDHNYYVQRAAREREAATRCEDNAVAAVHRRMAEEYDKIAKTGDNELRMAQNM